MSAPRIPKKESYWKNKGKREINGSYKNVMLYTHDDLDGIYSAIAIRNHLEKQGYTILGYGIVNYQDGWKYTTLHKDLINVAVDYASDHEYVDIYIDHHGEAFGTDNKKFSVKTATCSAYEGILLQCGIPMCSNLLEPIDMVDSAKYVHYNVDFASTLHMDWDLIKSSDNPKLTFVGSMNQLIKRSDSNTLIEVIHNSKDCSIYEIYRNLKAYYGGNNLFPVSRGSGRKDFVEDGKWRLDQMQSRTRGTEVKKVYTTQEDFAEDFYANRENRLSLNGVGYQILGNMAFIPSGTWANGIRARAILQEDIESGVIPDCIDYILLQYGNTLQMVCYGDIKDIPETERPILKDGTKVTNLGTYMENLLNNFKENLGYYDPKTVVGGDDDITVAGGHGGIGSISNICFKQVDPEADGVDILLEKFKKVKFIDLFKNKIISDISNIEWKDLRMSWSSEERMFRNTEPEMDNRVMMIGDIRNNPEDLTILEKKRMEEMEAL
jgi:hypothetical protein